MVSIVQQARAAWPLTRGSGFDMAEKHQGMPADFTVTVVPRNNQQQDSDSEKGQKDGGTPRGGHQDLHADRRSEETGSESETTLSVEEETRIHQKRERNRLAAARCRDRRRQRAATLVQESDDLEDENEELMKEIIQLQKEKRNLQETLCKHLPNCSGQSGEANQQQQIPHRLHGTHQRLEQPPQHLHSRQYHRQHQHPLFLTQQHQQQFVRQQRPQRSQPQIQEHHPQQKSHQHHVHRPQQPQSQLGQCQQHQLQQYDQQ